MTKPVFVGGALSFKGDKKTAKKKSRKSKHRKEEREEKQLEEDRRLESHVSGGIDDDLTEAERRALKFKNKREKKDMETVASKSHRERVEDFNQKLGELTELNDIPRVSAAGNG